MYPDGAAYDPGTITRWWGQALGGMTLSRPFLDGESSQEFTMAYHGLTFGNISYGN